MDKEKSPKPASSRIVVRKDYNEHLVLEVTYFGEHYILPQKGKPRSIGFDLTVPEDITVPAHSRFKIPLNIAINLPEGIEGKIEARSGFELYGMEGYGKRRVIKRLFGFIPFFWGTITGVQRWDCDVLVGKIDPGYTDNINVIVKNNDEEFTIKRGPRIAQMTFYRVLSPKFKIVDKLSCDSRNGGLGSSGTGPLPTTNTADGRDIGPVSFHKWYAGLSAEERAKVDDSPIGKVFNKA